MLRIIVIIDATMQMSDFKAKMHQNRFRLGLRPRPGWGSLRRSQSAGRGSAPRAPPFSCLRNSPRFCRTILMSVAPPLRLLCKLYKIWSVDSQDNILPELLKHMGPRAKLWLTSFFSRVVHEKRIPQTWRQAKIIAISKPGKDHSVAANYRPISLLSVCFKCLQRLILQRVKPVLEPETTIVEQAGFRSGRSTCDQVLALSIHSLEMASSLNRKPEPFSWI